MDSKEQKINTIKNNLRCTMLSPSQVDYIHDLIKLEIGLEIEKNVLITMDIVGYRMWITNRNGKILYLLMDTKLRLFKEAVQKDVNKILSKMRRTYKLSINNKTDLEIES